MNRETILADKLSTSYLVACRRVSLNRLAICASRHPQQCCMRDSKRIVCITQTYSLRLRNIYISINFRMLDIPVIYFSPRLSRARRISWIYNVLIALPAAVRCYTIIWLNQSLPLIRSGISEGNYWNGCLSWKYLE